MHSAHAGFNRPLLVDLAPFDLSGSGLTTALDGYPRLSNISNQKKTACDDNRSGDFATQSPIESADMLHC